MPQTEFMVQPQSVKEYLTFLYSLEMSASAIFACTYILYVCYDSMIGLRPKFYIPSTVSTDHILLQLQLIVKINGISRKSCINFDILPQSVKKDPIFYIFGIISFLN